MRKVKLLPRHREQSRHCVQKVQRAHWLQGVQKAGRPRLRREPSMQWVVGRLQGPCLQSAQMAERPRLHVGENLRQGERSQQPAPTRLMW